MSADNPRSRSGPSSGPILVQIVSVPEFIPLTVRFLGPYSGLETHWNGKRTVPCPGVDDCPSAVHRRGTIWKGYSAVNWWDLQRRLWIPAVLEITSRLEEQLRGKDLRGQVWTLTRTRGKGPTDPVIGVFCEQLDARKLPQAFDFVPVLVRVFNVSDLRLGKPNLIPEKVSAEVIADPAPNLPGDLVEQSQPANSEEARKASAEVWRKFREAGYRQTGQDPALPSSPSSNGHDANGAAG